MTSIIERLSKLDGPDSHAVTSNFSGYVVLPPLNPWEQEYKGLIYREIVMNSFAPSPERSWRRLIGYEVPREEVSIRTQRLHDRGYRIAKVNVEILEASSHDE